VDLPWPWLVDRARSARTHTRRHTHCHRFARIWQNLHGTADWTGEQASLLGQQTRHQRRRDIAQQRSSLLVPHAPPPPCHTHARTHTTHPHTPARTWWEGGARGRLLTSTWHATTAQHRCSTLSLSASCAHVQTPPITPHTHTWAATGSRLISTSPPLLPQLRDAFTRRCIPRLARNTPSKRACA